MPTIDPALVGENSSQLERLKFTTNSDGEVVIRTESTTAGIGGSGLVTVVTLNSSTWTALPASALSGRKALAIQNRSGIEIKINYSSGVVGYVGMVIPDGGERFYDIGDIVVYGKSASGTPDVNVEELA
ncbi:MAG: hypothetical protein E6R04_09635 [Spirochaetes bacterium]|nr:MAG: hypothetical protein E6R04_09635 [Spirochaetota bacterium]